MNQSPGLSRGHTTLTPLLYKKIHPSLIILLAPFAFELFHQLPDPNGFTVNPLKMLRGARPYQDFKEALDKLLAPPSK
jgi:hypothetical protein